MSERIDLLLGRLWFSLLVTGALACLSIVIALMTHRHIVKPLERLESVARTVRETGDHSLRTDHRANDELGRLSLAFNDMMSELAAARERDAGSGAGRHDPCRARPGLAFDHHGEIDGVDRP